MPRISLILFVLILSLSALPVCAGERAPAPDPGPAAAPAEPDPDEPVSAAGKGHGSILEIGKSNEVAMVVGDKGITFKKGDRLLLVTEGPEIAYLLVDRIIASKEITLVYCTVEKGSKQIKKDQRIINLRIRDEESPIEKPTTDTEEPAEEEKPKTDEEDVMLKSKALKAARMRITELQDAITILSRRLENLEKKVKAMDRRLVSVEKLKPDTSRKLPKGLKPDAEGFVVHVKKDGGVAVSIGVEVGIRIGTTLYIYRPKGDGDFWYIGSITVTRTAEDVSTGPFLEKKAEPMERDLVTVLPKRRAQPAGGSEKKSPK